MIDYGFIRKVSVDHERAGLRADRDHSFRLRGLSCQSIMSALACALVTTQSKTSGFKVCQSIMSALACALVVFSTRPLPVSIKMRMAPVAATYSAKRVADCAIATMSSIVSERPNVAGVTK